jgi:serine phosphatase RsbU (regulator of sigma subunit)
MQRMGISPRANAGAASIRLDRQQPFLCIQSVTIFVRELESSLRFYLDQLGFHLIFDGYTKPGRRWVTVAPPDGTANLSLVAPEPDSPEYKLIGRSTHVSFVTEDVLAKYLEWTKHGVRFNFTPRLKRLKNEVRGLSPQAIQHVSPGDAGAPPAEEPAPIWGGVFTRFKDPDGNSFSLVSFDEVTHAVEAQRRAAAERLHAERRAAHELEIAKEVQSRFFPQSQPVLKTLDYAGACHQARAVGGDYFDFLHLGGGRLGLVIGDISGKGIAAALLMANLQANLRSQCALAVDQPQLLLQSVNRLFCENTADSAFATLFFAEYDDAHGRLRYVNCGHLPALILRPDDTIEHLHATATVLGMFKAWDCEVGETRLLPGDALALYTDGITESFNDADEQFGEDRLAAALLRHRALCPQSMLTAVVDEVRQFSLREQHDDITLIIAKCPTI